MKKFIWLGCLLFLGAIVSTLLIQSSALPNLAERNNQALCDLDPDQEKLYLEVQDLIDKEAFAAMESKYQQKFVEIMSMTKESPESAIDRPMACFAPGTTEAELQQFYSFYANTNTAISLYLDDENGFQAPDANRWSTTASGGGLGQGDPTTLTWSYVPDGTTVMFGCGVPGEMNGDASNLIAFLNGIYGAPAVPGDFTTAPWHALFVAIFAQWSTTTGLSFIYEPMDDGLTGPTPFATGANPGVLGTRGDIRIGGHRIDGNSMVLACNYFPNTGDMIIDTEDNFYGTAGTPPADLTGVRNVLAHEIGHGLGMRHVCPVNTTKLMEPFVTFAFMGPQEDDILAGNRLYADPDDNNETFGTATGLGAIANPGMVTRMQRSIDDNADQDFFSFSFAGAGDVTVTMTPTGTTYNQGPQTNPCGPGAPFNALTVADLEVELRAMDGTTVLSTGNANGAGVAETAMQAGLAAGTYFARVSQTGSAAMQDVQMYNLQVSVAPAGAPACMITAISTANISACNNNGTPAVPGDDFFTADVTVTYANPPGAGNLNLTGDGTATVAVGGLGSPTMHTFVGVMMSADGTPINLTATFDAMPACTFTNAAAGTAPMACSAPPMCSVTAISVANISACMDNGTTANAADDFFTADVTVMYMNPPGAGTLDLTGDGMASVAVGGLGSPTMHTFVGVMMTADGGPISLTATFSGMPACTLTNATAGMAPASCATAIVPTMGEWGIMILGLFMAIFGIVAVRSGRISLKPVTVTKK